MISRGHNPWRVENNGRARLGNCRCEKHKEAGPQRHPPTRPPVTAAVAAARLLDSDDPRPKPTKSLSAESRQAILQGRVANKWNQAQLNAQCSFPQNTIRDIENGKLCPTPQQLNVLSRVLKVVLKYA